MEKTLQNRGKIKPSLKWVTCIISDGLKSHFMFLLFVSFKQQLINRELPENVNLLTLENRSDGSYLIRLEHIYDVGEDKVLSKPVTVSLKVIFPFVLKIKSITLVFTINIFKDLFPGFAIISAEETVLGGNQLKKDSQRLVWYSSDKQKAIGRSSHSEFPDVELQPMEIRTFILNLVRDNRLDKYV